MKLIDIFESEQVTNYLHLQKTEMNDQQFLQLLAIRPSEINIILSRVVDFIKNTGTKGKHELITDILEVLERSTASRKFVGLGLMSEYSLFKGLPVRRGDQFESMPDIGTPVDYQSQDVISSWTTNAPEAKKLSTEYDATKGEPIGGLVLQTKVDSGKLLFDINAVIKVCRSKLNLLNQYNTNAAPGKSLSKENINFLATQAPLFYGNYEVITDNSISHLKVFDKWTWSEENGKKQPKWEGDNMTAPSNEVQPPVPNETDTEQTFSKPQIQPPQPNAAIQESLKRKFNTILTEAKAPKIQRNSIFFPSYQLEEDWRDKFHDAKDWILKTAGVTVRGKTLKYLEAVIKQYEFHIQAFEHAEEFANEVDDNSLRVQEIDNEKSKVENDLDIAKEVYEKVKLDNERLSFAHMNDEENDSDSEAVADEPEEEEQVAEEAIMNEDVLNLFAKISDAKLNSTSKKSAKELAGTFNKMIKSMDQHFKYRLMALRLQKDLLGSDYKNYQNTRFVNRPEVQKLKGMIDKTDQSIEMVNNEKRAYDSVKHHADDFTLSGRPEDKPKADAIKQEIKKEIEPEIAGDFEVGNKTKDMINSIKNAINAPIEEPKADDASPFPDDNEDVPTAKVDLNAPTAAYSDVTNGDYPATTVNNKTGPLSPKAEPVVDPKSDIHARIDAQLAKDPNFVAGVEKAKKAKKKKVGNKILHAFNQPDVVQSQAADAENLTKQLKSVSNAPEVAPTPEPVAASEPVVPAAEPETVIPPVATAPAEPETVIPPVEPIKHPEEVLKNSDPAIANNLAKHPEYVQLNAAGPRFDKLQKENPQWKPVKVNNMYRLYSPYAKVPTDAIDVSGLEPEEQKSELDEDRLFNQKDVLGIITNKKLLDQYENDKLRKQEKLDTSERDADKHKYASQIADIDKQIHTANNNLKVLLSVVKDPAVKDLNTLVSKYDAWKHRKSVEAANSNNPSVSLPLDAETEKELARAKKTFNGLNPRAVFTLPAHRKAADIFKKENNIDDEHTQELPNKVIYTR